MWFNYYFNVDISFNLVSCERFFYLLKKFEFELSHKSLYVFILVRFLNFKLF